MAKNQSLAQFFASRGMRLRTWARAKKLNSKDMQLLYKVSYGAAQGLRGRAKELKGLLEKEGFRRALEKSVASKGACGFNPPPTPSAREGAFSRNNGKDDKKGA